jgi:hypothetical protein
VKLVLIIKDQKNLVFQAIVAKVAKRPTTNILLTAVIEKAIIFHLLKDSPNEAKGITSGLNKGHLDAKLESLWNWKEQIPIHHLAHSNGTNGAA